MKKRWIVCLLAILLLVGCQKKPIELTDGQRLKKEYEALNNQKDENGNSYSNIIVDGNNTAHYAHSEDLEELFLRGSHVVYLGWPDCGWCRRALPVLVDTINEYSGINLYIYNIKEARDAYEHGLDNDLAKLYKEVCEAIEYADLDFSDFPKMEDGTLKLPSSAVYFVKNGVVSSIHIRTVDSHLDPYEPLTDDQKEELKQIYRESIDALIRDNNPGCGSCE